jgi:rare lipoprotein A
VRLARDAPSLLPAIALAVLLAGCASAPEPASAPPPEPKPVPPRGAFYKDDGPGANPPASLAAIPDAVPKVEPLHRFANRPYQRFGRNYVPLTSVGAFRETGFASWYGRRYHGAATSSGELYDMYAMTAAHPILPIPSYARVTNIANGKSVVVRINDRGPFLADRIIDLSYAAAWKLGIADAGSARVLVEAIVPGKLTFSSLDAVPEAGFLGRAWDTLRLWTK